MIRTKADVDFHGDVPAVNVKLRRFGSQLFTDLPLPLCRVSDDGGKTWTDVYTDPRFTEDWMREHLSDDEFEQWMNLAREDGWEMLTDIAKEIFGRSTKVYSGGRSGGWAEVYGLSDVEDWDAIALNDWRKFEKAARAIAEDIPYQTLSLIHMNVWEPMAEAAERLDQTNDWREALRCIDEGALEL